MCGLFGAIAPMGQRINPIAIRALALANRARGIDSLGFFDAKGEIFKKARDPIDVLVSQRCQDYIIRACENWYIAGHTRAATRGIPCKANSHPFQYGKIIGSHNGCVAAPMSYKVDSQYIFDSLAQCENDYQTALSDLHGWWALTWSYKGKLYLQTHNGNLAIGQDDSGVFYYSSSWEHLLACLPDLRNVSELGEGETWEFSRGEKGPKFLDTFISSAKSQGIWYRYKDVREDESSWDKDDMERWERTAGFREAWEKYSKLDS